MIMTSPGIKIINKVSIEDTLNYDRSEEQVIQINVSNEPQSSEPIFNPANVSDEVVRLNLHETEVENSNDNSSSIGNPDTVPLVKLEIDNPDCEMKSSETADDGDKNKSQRQDNVFMVPPLLRIRQFATQERIPISIEEIRRRISPPESLSQALILSLLRLNKERAKYLRKALTQFGITELPGRSAVVSSFSRLSEVESRGLAEDYYYLASRFMKVKEMNQTLIAQNGGEVFFTPKARAARLTLEQILEEIEKRDKDLNLLTHGFSPLILRAVFNILFEVLTFKEREKELMFETPNKIIL